MPPCFLDLDLEPWTTAEQAPSSASRVFQQEEAGPSMQRTPSKRKHPNFDSTPQEPSNSKRHKSLSETELGIIKLAAGILDVPVSSLLAAQSGAHARSEGSSITYDSLEAPSTGPEQTDGFDISVEPPQQAPHRQQPAPTSAPTFQSQAAFNGSGNVGYQEPHTFRGDLNINSKNHLEWWSLNGGMVFDDFEAPITVSQQNNPSTRQDPINQLNDWSHPRFEEVIHTSESGAGGQPAWGSAPQGLHNGYHGPIQSQSIPTDSLQHPGPIGVQISHPNVQMFGPFPYSARPRPEARMSEINPAMMKMDQKGDILGTTFGNQDMRPSNHARVTENNSQTFALKRPRQRRNHSSGDGRRPGRRGPLTEEQRLETSLTRRQGACIRCQWQAIKCERDPLDPDGCCLTCRKVYGQTMTRLPCLRYKINDAQLVDKDTHPKYIWSRRWDSMKIVEIEEWRSSEIKSIVVTQDVGGIGNATYELQVREFVPVEGDSLFRGWKTNGIEKKHACTPYAIANMAQTGLQFMAFADKHIGTFIKFYINKNDKLMWNTYYMAYKYSQSVPRKEERDLLRNALKLWVGSRMESRRERICSSEVLGMEPQNWDLEGDNYGAYLIPPVLQAQIELLTTACVLLPMKREVLKGLQKLMKANQTKSWFTIYLCMFLLMHSCALLTQAENLRARREPRISDLHPQARYYNPGLVEELHTGANILLAHFHYCNKGSHPFALDWRTADNSSIAFAELGREEKSYMQEATDEVKRRAHWFKEIKEMKKFEDDYYFLSQLYEYNWTPVHTV